MDASNQIVSGHNGHSQAGQPPAQQARRRSNGKRKSDSSSSDGYSQPQLASGVPNAAVPNDQQVFQGQWSLDALRPSPMEQAVIQREMQNLDISAMQQLMAEQPLMAGQMQATGDAQLHHAAQPGLQPNQPFLSPTTSLQGLDDSMLDMDEADMELGSPRAVNNGKRKTGRSSNINQHEMQKIFEANKHRTLEDAAKPLRGDDQGAHTERNKQILAMLWINEACYSGVGSVPRGSVYGIYCLYCLMAGNIQPLNPASFGKLVRVIFPGLTTRRLGVRGESKYHYVNFCLRDQWARMELQLPALKSEVPASKKKRPRQGNEPSAVEPSTKKSRSVDGDRDRRPTGYGVYADRPTGNAVDFGASRLKVTVPLALLSRLPDVPQLKGIEERVLETFPDIAPYLPEGVTRQDSPASTLIALYTNHSLSLVKSLMMTKRKEFFKHYTSLSGTFTTPVQKLFYSPELAPWIQAVDLMAYQHMSRLLLWLSTQNMPKHAIDFFEAIGENLVSHIQTAFSAAPPHVLKARIVPAAIFAQITRRCLRVNAAALRIGDPLAMPAIRDAMYADFIRKVSVDSLVSIAVPEMAMDDLAKTLVSGLPAAIAPTAEFLERNDSVFNQFATNNSLPKELAETSLGPWVGLLLSLKTRFPYASATDVMNGLEMIATRFMEELTLDSPSFGTWWLVKCFVTEWFHMMCETGGLIEMASRAQDSAAAGATDDDAEGPSESSDEHSQHRAASPETADTPQMDASASFGLDVAAGQSGSRQQGQQAEDHAAFPATTNGYHVAGAASPSGNMHDDSGIGMMATPPADLKGQVSGAENEPVGAYVGA